MLMADHNTVISQAEISALKDALGAQQKLLQKLYNELEAEREASATAASEALSVILRLQGEKAAVKMEAEQYKRLAEERMCHAEESFAIIEDIITQKEMEMADLDYQVQTYKYQLMSMGLVDPSDDDVKIPEHLLQRKDCLDNTSLHHLGRRNSAPLLVRYKKAMLERESSCSPDMMHFSSKDEQMSQEINDVASESDKKADCYAHGGINSYAEQIRELEQRVKEIAGANYGSPSISSRPSSVSMSNLSNLQHETRPASPQPSVANSYEPSKIAVVESMENEGEVVDYQRSSSVHDVFEVPQADEDYDFSRKKEKEMDSRPIEVLESNDCGPTEGVKSEWLKKMLESNNNDKNLASPGGVANIDRAVVRHTRSVSESNVSLRKLERSSRVIEVERAECSRREEELKLLKDIKEKLNLLQDEIRCRRKKESSMREMPSLGPLPEAMLYFWL